MANAPIDHWNEAFRPFNPLQNPVPVGDYLIGDGSLVLIAGPCAIESESLCMKVAEHLTRLCQDLKVSYIFKSSFDKANRTSIDSFRGLGLEYGLNTLAKVKNEFGIPTLTDVHETYQVEDLASVVDIIQIPAFLCRQTDLIVECGKKAKSVNIKKGQFLAADDMKYAADKVESTGNSNIILTERGAIFGYRDLILDLRNLVIMRETGYPVIYDATHSVQQLGGNAGSSGGLTQYIPAQVRGAIAVGIDGLFVETHPDPHHALSDGSTMVPLSKMRDLINMAMELHSIHNPRGKE